MQMTGICVCLPYADARHMDMLCISCFLIFPPQIRKLPVPDVCKVDLFPTVLAVRGVDLFPTVRAVRGVDLFPTLPAIREVDLFPIVRAVREVDLFPIVLSVHKVDLFPTEDGKLFLC